MNNKIRTKCDENLEKLLNNYELESADDLEDDDEEEQEFYEITDVDYEEEKSAIVVTDDLPEQEQDRINDYKFARTIYKKNCKMGAGMLEYVKRLVKESENPRFIASATELIKQMKENADSLVSLHNKGKGAQTAKSITNNTQINHNTIQKPDNNVSEIEKFLDNQTDTDDYEEEESSE